MPSNPRKIRYAVIGLGHIAQTAILPAMANTTNSELTALVSGDEEKLRRLQDRYGAKGYTYSQYEDCLRSGEIDAVFIATPNDQHREHTVKAAQAGIHVLCEKPLAANRQDCAEMIEACREANVKLMTAYRLHFEEANLQAMEIARSGRLGDLRYFNSLFSYQVRAGNIRVRKERGGGPTGDIGIYCINAARYIFQDDPVEVVAFADDGQDDRFAEVPSTVSAVLRFPQGRLATFTCSFAAAAIDQYEVIGTKGRLRVSPCYEYSGERKHYLTIDGTTEERSFSECDQFAAEIEYFSSCILNDTEPEPDGPEGMLDVEIVEAIHKSAQSGQAVKIVPFQRNRQRPGIGQLIRRPPVQQPEPFHAEEPVLSS